MKRNWGTRGSLIALGAFVTLGLGAGPALADNDVGCGIGTTLMKGKSGLVFHVLASCTNAYTLQSVSLTFNMFGCDSKGKVTVDAELRKFAATNIDQLARDMARGEGETLAAFATCSTCPGRGAGAPSAPTPRPTSWTSSRHDGVTSNEMIDAFYRLLGDPQRGLRLGTPPPRAGGVPAQPLSRRRLRRRALLILLALVLAHGVSAAGARRGSKRCSSEPRRTGSRVTRSGRRCSTSFRARFGLRRESEIPGGSLLPRRRTAGADPAAELEATLRALLEARTDRGRRRRALSLPRPRELARARSSGVPLERFAAAPCPALDEWRKGLAPRGITLIFPEAFMNNPASMFGHTLLRLDVADPQRAAEPARLRDRLHREHRRATPARSFSRREPSASTRATSA